LIDAQQFAVKLQIFMGDNPSMFGSNDSQAMRQLVEKLSKMAIHGTKQTDIKDYFIKE
jgi:hypothetical protein